MSNGRCPDKNPLQRDGTSQQQRLPEALEPGFAPIHEFTEKDWLKFAWHYAEKVNFYADNDVDIKGNWQKFFIETKDLPIPIASTGSTEPHLALFITFIRLLANSQQQMNGLTKRHLDFYYEKVLQLNHKKALPDNVFVLFELAKNAPHEHLAKRTALDAGTDARKIPLQYELLNDVVVNNATVSHLKSLYHQKEDGSGSGEKRSLRFADVANSIDGLGAALPESNPAWFAFGHGKLPNVPSLPVAKVGFAVASSVLLLKEGQRTITTSISFTSNIDLPLNGAAANITVLITSEKGWASGIVDEALTKYDAATKTLVIVFALNDKEKAVVGFDKSIHNENFTTDLPVVRFLLQPDNAINNGYELYASLSKASVADIKIEVAVTGIKTFQIENDNGVLDPAKPFLPFGTIPAKGSNFYIGNAEILQKNWGKIDLNITWKGLPENLADHYMAYQKSYLIPTFTPDKYNLKAAPTDGKQVENNSYFKADVYAFVNGNWQATNTDTDKTLFAASGSADIQKKKIELLKPTAGAPAIKAKKEGKLFTSGTNKNKAFLYNYYNTGSVQNYPSGFDPGFEKSTVTSKNFAEDAKQDYLKIELQNSFLQEYFPRLYAAAISRTTHDVILPMEPYIPVIASLSLDYSASAANGFRFNPTTAKEDILENYRKRTIQLFHEGPFGQSEQHVFLQQQNSAVPGNNQGLTLVPSYSAEGEFLVGLQHSSTGTIVSILFQVAEGSENPIAPSFTAQTGNIEWFALCNNEWKTLNREYIISDNTNNFLRPGIIRFLIPNEANDDNTILPGGVRWLMARLPATIRYDSVCKFTLVAAQAAQAIFVNHDNDLAHLADTLAAGTITKVVERPAGIKSVTQPFNSFGGKPTETDNQFYTRISERLRHKNRAVNIYDYERIILEQFPDVYKVKCLNHTSVSSTSQTGYELDPGFVTIIPIPSVRNKNLYDILKPRLPVNKLREIEKFLKDLYSMHVELAAAHPDFEEVTCSFDVKFYPEYDPQAHIKILNEDLKKYLAPWAYNEFSDISFGGSLYKTIVIGFIENREYVDYVSNFIMQSDELPGKDRNQIAAANSMTILTSAQNHVMHVITPDSICAIL